MASEMGDFRHPELPQRKNIRLRGYDYSHEGYYFITICTNDRKKLLGHVFDGKIELTKCGVIAERNLINIPNHVEGVLVDKFVVMPNHVHVILIVTKNVGTPYMVSAGNERTPYMASLQAKSKQTVSKTIQQYKASVTRDSATVGLWQSRFHDRIIRDEYEYQNKWRYIDENIIKWHEDCYYT